MSSPHPLSGLTVVEIGHSVAAPYAGMILGELGAEVIKVENPKGGDACRGWGPPFTEGTATAFHAFNRAKRGITIDLGDPAEVDKLRALIRDRADVLIHNLKHGTLDRYGLSADALLAEKPDLVYCNLGGLDRLSLRALSAPVIRGRGQEGVADVEPSPTLRSYGRRDRL